MKIFGSEITPYATYLNRRKFIKGSMAASIVSSISSSSFGQNMKMKKTPMSEQLNKEDKLNKYEEITNYNNFYEFGMGKEDPATYSQDFNPRPWSITIEGLVNKPQILDLEILLSKVTIEDRIYRLRCVEGWSMVIPWQGFSLFKLIKIAEPLNSAKFIQFETVYRPKEMPGQKRRILPWPYVEGLRMDEAMHPLTLFSTGLYGHNLLNQNGAPTSLNCSVEVWF